MIYTDQEKLRSRTIARGIGTRIFNERVKERYQGNEDFLEALTIQPFDALLDIVNKKIDFYFTHENFVPTYEEKVHLRNKPRGGINDELYPWLKLHLKFSERFIRDQETGVIKPLGQRSIRISNVDPQKFNKDAVKKAFDNVTFQYGDHLIKYIFSNARELKLLHAHSKQDGVNLIKAAFPFVRDDLKHDGNIEDNILTVNAPKNSPKADTHGLVGHIFKVTLYEMRGKKATKIESVMISNKVKQIK